VRPPRLSGASPGFCEQTTVRRSDTSNGAFSAAIGAVGTFIREKLGGISGWAIRFTSPLPLEQCRCRARMGTPRRRCSARQSIRQSTDALVWVPSRLQFGPKVSLTTDVELNPFFSKRGAAPRAVMASSRWSATSLNALFPTPCFLSVGSVTGLVPL
jgi:hypothetical protein